MSSLKHSSSLPLADTIFFLDEERQALNWAIVGGACGNTTASGIAGALPNETGVGLLLNVFSQRKDCADPAAVSVSFECSACAETPEVRLMVLNQTTSVYDQVRRHAARNEGWLQHDDGEVYPLPMMLTPAGMAGIKGTAPHWLAQQQAVFSPRALEATDGVSLKCASGGCTLSLVAAPPSTFAVWVKTDDAGAAGLTLTPN